MQRKAGHIRGLETWGWEELNGDLGDGKSTQKCVRVRRPGHEKE